MLTSEERLQRTFSEILRYLRELASIARREELAAMLQDEDQRTAPTRCQMACAPRATSKGKAKYQAALERSRDGGELGWMWE